MSDGRTELHADFQRRMVNWARWKLGGVATAEISSVYSDSTGGGYREAPIPLLHGEAEDTEAALNAIPERYRYAVQQVWVYLGRPSAWHARLRGIDYRTWDVWVRRGHQMLQEELARRAVIAKMLKVQRDEVERASRAA